jgi:hypothetical protein
LVRTPSSAGGVGLVEVLHGGADSECNWCWCVLDRLLGFDTGDAGGLTRSGREVSAFDFAA